MQRAGGLCVAELAILRLPRDLFQVNLVSQRS